MPSVRRDREPSDLLRCVGGLLLAVGAVVVLGRSQEAPHWTEFERVLVISLPVALLYGLAVGRRSGAEATGPRAESAPWRSVLLVTSALLAPAALLTALAWLGVATGKWSVHAAVAIVTALLAFVGARRARAPYGMFVAAIALLVAWLIVWGKIVHDPSPDDYRWFLVGGAVLLVGLAAGMAASGALGAREIAVAGGISGVAAGAAGIFIGGFASAFLVGGGVTSSGVSEVGLTESCRATSRGVQECVRGTPHHVHADASPFPHGLLPSSGLQHFGWDLYLVIVSLLLVWAGSRVKARGLGYVGAVGLFAFTLSVGAQLTRIEGGQGPDHSLLGWPVALVALGLLALAAPLLSGRRLRRER